MLISPLNLRLLTTLDGIGIVQSLQDLHDMLIDYHPPKVVHPSIESLRPYPQSFLGSLFHRKSPKRRATQIPANLPKGLYMHGDVGSGKTMLMDIFYDTLPYHVTSKTRIHFHNFMQDVHKRLHQIKMEHGSDLDAMFYVAVDIAEKGGVLCLDEFQCTDVADAMILRRCVSPTFIIGSGTDQEQFTRSSHVSWSSPRDNVESTSQRPLQERHPAFLVYPLHQPSQEPSSCAQSRFYDRLQENPSTCVRRLPSPSRQGRNFSCREVVSLPRRPGERPSAPSYSPSLGTRD